MNSILIQKKKIPGHFSSTALKPFKDTVTNKLETYKAFLGQIILNVHLILQAVSTEKGMLSEQEVCVLFHNTSKN